jgi:hypothetical protein
VIKTFKYLGELENIFKNVRTGKRTFNTRTTFFVTLDANGLAINLEKCVYAVPTLEFLGHKILATGLAPAADHAAKIKNCPPPRTLSNCYVFSAW